MGREKQLPWEKLGEDAAEGPNVAGLIPLTALQYYFGPTILAGVYHWTMILVSEGRSSEINQFYTIAHWHQISLLSLLVFIFQVLRAKQYVFRLEIRMNKTNSMHEWHCLEKLSSEGLYEGHVVAFMVVFLKDVVEWGTECLKDDTVVAMMKKTFNISNDVVFIVWVASVQLFNYLRFGTRRFSVFFNWLNHLTSPTVTLIALRQRSYLPSSTLPKVPVPITLVILYLCPTRSPTLSRKCGVDLRLRVAGETDPLSEE